MVAVRVGLRVASSCGGMVLDWSLIIIIRRWWWMVGVYGILCGGGVEC